jgi:outer membrane biosynthesis protein TonB
MRTPAILIAAVILTATAAHAGPRSLSTGQSESIELPPSKVQILEAPQPVIEAPKPTEFTTSTPARTEPAQTAPVQAAPAQAAPAKPIETAPTIQARPVETKAVETKTVEATPEAKPVRRAQRKQHHREASAEQRMHREFRNIERIIVPAIGIAIAGSSIYW